MTRLTMWIVIACLWLLFAAVWANSYRTSQQLVTNQRAGCLRGMSDRRANAAAWFAAYRARFNEAEATSNTDLKAVYVATARIYWNTAWTLNHHTDRAHTLVVRGRVPLGLGSVDCEKAYPDASPVAFFGLVQRTGTSP